ncbi:flavin reductase family protein [Ideonella azotifigens]|uniref:Flavin reductase like domain-containing protein n=2 Tax=Ideonella azotifigens TaxID=513160 RepID=A0ABP3VFT5_9BURK|nr:flavin reductase family protein [Ideonella azotifigens]
MLMERLIDPLDLRHALGRFATGVTIVTCRDAAGRAVGLTANSFNALSLDPPLVLWSLRSGSPNRPIFEQASHFAINVLGQGQMELSRRFATPHADRFAEGPWHDGPGGVPLLEGALANFSCQLHSAQEAGDHVLFIGRVLALQHHAGAPLVFQSGHYRAVGEPL